MLRCATYLDGPGSPATLSHIVQRQVSQHATAAGQDDIGAAGSQAGRCQLLTLQQQDVDIESTARKSLTKSCRWCSQGFSTQQGANPNVHPWLCPA